jgi:hypothetical protein
MSDRVETWRPADTAPRDGRSILVKNQLGDIRVWHTSDKPEYVGPLAALYDQWTDIPGE